MRTIVGIGEILWDLLPSGKQLGGAPTNFAYHAALLGNRSVVASRVGADALGAEVHDRLALLGARASLDTGFLQEDCDHPTGTVEVTLVGGQPSYIIHEDVAWDMMAWTPAWEALAGGADAICFGSLAQRSAVSQETIQRFLRAARADCLKVFDVNLRQHYYDAAVLRTSLELADVVKLNDEELPIVVDLLGLKGGAPEVMAEQLRACFALDGVVMTRGAEGAMLLRSDGYWEVPGIRVEVVDTVGAGDAFTAAAVHGWLEGWEPEKILEQSNARGAWVAAQAGGTPAE